MWDWVSFLAYPNLFGIKGFVVVVVESGILQDFYLFISLVLYSSFFRESNSRKCDI
jgi:hypothetical protein